jgi:hypothetical protein
VSPPLSHLERVLLQAELVALEAKAKVIREQLDGSEGPPAPAASPAPGGRRSLGRKRQERVAPPSADELEGVSELDRRAAREMLERSGRYR